MSLENNRLIGFGAGAEVGPTTVTYIGSATATLSGSTYTASSASIGTAASDRLVVAVMEIINNNNTTAASGAIGGSAASVAVSYGTASGGCCDTTLGMIYLLVTSGTTANIAFTMSGSGGAASASIDIYNVNSWVSSTPYSTLATGGTSSNTTTSGTLDTPGNGAIIAGAGYFTSGTFTWSLATTEDRDAAGTTGGRVTAAHATGLSAVTGATLQVVNTSANDRRGLIGATWR